MWRLMELHVTRYDERYAIYRNLTTEEEIKITETGDGYWLRLYDENDKLTARAFWHRGDMDDVRELQQKVEDKGEEFDEMMIWTHIFGAPQFPQCLEWVDWEEVDDEADEDN